MNGASGSQKRRAEKSDRKKTERMDVKAERGIEFILLKTSLKIVCGLIR